MTDEQPTQFRQRIKPLHILFEAREEKLKDADPLGRGYLVNFCVTEGPKEHQLLKVLQLLQRFKRGGIEFDSEQSQGL